MDAELLAAFAGILAAAAPVYKLFSHYIDRRYPARPCGSKKCRESIVQAIYGHQVHQQARSRANGRGK